jgi:serine/threonine-protein kinase
MISWLVSAHHVASSGEVFLFLYGLQRSLFWSCFAGLIYLAFEPYLRRHTPERVISWNRLLAGDWRDPLVGRDILIGLTIGSIAIIAFSLRYYLPVWLGEAPPLPWFISSPNGAALLGIRSFPVLLTNQLVASLVQGFMVVFLILFFTVLFRNRRSGVAAAWLLIFAFSALGAVTAKHPLSGLAISMLFPSILVFTAARFGVLAVTSTIVAYHLVVFYPITTELTAWYAADYVLCVIFLLALAFFAFRQSLAGQPIFQGKLLGESDLK